MLPGMALAFRSFAAAAGSSRRNHRKLCDSGQRAWAWSSCQSLKGKLQFSKRSFRYYRRICFYVKNNTNNNKSYIIYNPPPPPPPDSLPLPSPTANGQRMAPTCMYSVATGAQRIASELIEAWSYSSVVVAVVVVVDNNNYYYYYNYHYYYTTTCTRSLYINYYNYI